MVPKNNEIYKGNCKVLFSKVLILGIDESSFKTPSLMAVALKYVHILIKRLVKRP